MLGIILIILKIIGITLAVLVGLILLILLLLLFVPFRYKGEGEYPLKLHAICSWLLHILHVNIDSDGSGLVLVVRIFGIKIFSNAPGDVRKKEEKLRKKKEKKKAKRKKKKQKEKEKRRKNAKKTGAAESKTESKVESKTESKTESKVESKTESKDESKAESKVESKTESKDESKTESKDESRTENEAGSQNEEEPKPTLEEKINRVVEKLKKIYNKISGLLKKAQQIRDFKDDPGNRRAVAYIWKKLKVIIRRLLPSRLCGRVAFGFEDPSTTGKICGIVSLFIGLWGGSFTLEPDFNGKRIEAELKAKGHIRLGGLVIPALFTWFNKDVKYFRGELSKLKGSDNGSTGNGD